MDRFVSIAPQVRYEAFAKRQYEGLWLTVTGDTYQVMRIKAKSHAQILLTKIPGVATLTAYEITIGADFNMATTIRELKTDTQLTTKGTPEILNKEELRWFWVSWGDNDESGNTIIKVKQHESHGPL